MTPNDSADARREEIERIAVAVSEHRFNLRGDCACGKAVGLRDPEAIARHLAAALYDAGLRATTGLDAARIARLRLDMIDGIGADLSREFAQGDPFEPFDRTYVVKRLTRVLDDARDRARLAATPQEKPAVAETCRCTADTELAAGSVCAVCGHRDHGRSGCPAPVFPKPAVAERET